MAGTKKTLSTIQSEIDSKITSNGNQEITGAILNGLFHDIVVSLLWGTQQREEGVTVLYNGGAGTVVTFPDPFPAGATVHVICQVRDANGNPIDGILDPADTSITSFKVKPEADGDATYVAFTWGV